MLAVRAVLVVLGVLGVPGVLMAVLLAGFKVIVVDESHYLKSADSKRTKSISPLVTGARRCLLLSGTPALSRPIELYVVRG